MDDQTSQPFGQLVDKALTDVAASLEQSTRESKTSNGSSEIDRKLHFLKTFRRWEMLFKRADRGDGEAEKWLISEYYKSLGELDEHGLELLTDELKTRCTFFPTIKECLEIINPPRYSYANPFNNGAHRLGQRRGLDEIGSPEWMNAARNQLTDQR